MASQYIKKRNVSLSVLPGTFMNKPYKTYYGNSEQRKRQSGTLAILTLDEELDAALSEFMEAYYEDNTSNLRKV
jgi:hypothetical protein